MLQRTQEIGIRIALGARSVDVLRMVLRRTLALAGAGAALGLAVSFVVTRSLSQFLFEVRPNDPATFAGVVLLIVGAALAAGLVPALHATRVNPVDALRHE